jgi:hypothetical protein
MPSLTQLQIQQTAAGQNLQLLASVRWPALRSLDVDAFQLLDDCCCLRTLKQLKRLSLTSWVIKGMGALAQLAGLTSLQLSPAPFQSAASRLITAAQQS